MHCVMFMAALPDKSLHVFFYLNPSAVVDRASFGGLAVVFVPQIFPEICQKCNLIS